jgi:hypothetical protein
MSNKQEIVAEGNGASVLAHGERIQGIRYTLFRRPDIAHAQTYAGTTQVEGTPWLDGWLEPPVDLRSQHGDGPFALELEDGRSVQFTIQSGPVGGLFTIRCSSDL